MKSTRALPALLALSLLTGCDVASFMPDFNKSPVTKGPGTENPGPTLKEPTAEQKEQAAEFADTTRSAAAQSLAAVTAINSLKSVAAFGSPSSGYRTAGITLPDTPDATQNIDNDTFNGTYSRLGNEYYMDGTFSLKPDVTAEGQAKLETNQEMPPSDMRSFRATASVEVTVGDISVEQNEFLLALTNKKVRVTLYKDSDLIESTLFGTYEIEDGQGLLLGGQGKLEVDLLRNAWTVENIIHDTFSQRMTFEPNGSGQGATYLVKPAVGGFPQIDYDQPLVRFTWGVDGKLTFFYPDGAIVPAGPLFQ